MALVIEAGDTSYDNGDNASDTSHDLTIPNYADGDLVVVVIPFVPSGAAATSITFPAGLNAETFTEVVNSVGSGIPAAGDAWTAIGYYIGDGAGTSGTINFVPAAAARLTLQAIVIPAGEFDATTPISSAISTDNGTSGTGTMPAFSANADDAGGKLILTQTVDTDTVSGGNPSGYTTFIEQDAGRVTHCMYARDAAVTASESIGSAATSGFDDAWNVYGFIVREVVAGGATITSVSGDNIFADGDSGVPIVGTGFV